MNELSCTRLWPLGRDVGLNGSRNRAPPVPVRPLLFLAVIRTSLGLSGFHGCRSYLGGIELRGLWTGRLITLLQDLLHDLARRLITLSQMPKRLVHLAPQKL